MDSCFVLLILTLGVNIVDADCNSPENISGSTFVVAGSSPYPDGTQVEYTCNIGQKPYGDSRIYTCQGGVWVGNFECKKITCSYKAPPANGKYSTSPTYEIGTEMRLECYSGYDRNGTSRLLCMADGAWDPEMDTTCTAKNCGDFGSVINGDARQNIQNGIRNSYGSVVTITCYESYVIVGSPHVECQASGSWGAKPSCELVSCPTYSGASTGCVDHTELSSNKRFLEIFCKSGPNISVTKLGEYDVYCNDNQEWEGDQIACYCDCKVLVDETRVTLNNLDSNGFLKHARELSWTCKKGVKNMTEKVVCKDGVIGTNLCTCNCNSPENISGATFVVNGSSPYHDGAQVEYTCDIGHRQYGDSRIYTCQGCVWVGNFECKKITPCTKKAPPTHGKYSTPPTYQTDSDINFKCNSGYVLNGPSRLLCMADGTWEPDLDTTCTPKNCGDFGSVINGDARQNIQNGIRNSYGSVVTIICDASHVIVGSPHVECQASGSWVYTEKPSCERVGCPTYPGASTGCVDYTTLDSNKHFLEIICKSGANISVTQLGEYDLYCKDEDNRWIGVPMACYCDCKVSFDETRVTLNNLESNGFLKHGSTLSWTCKKGLNNMTENVVCNDGVIGTNLCDGPCSSPPRVDNATVVTPYPEYGLEETGYRTGDTVKFECYSSYQMQGSESLTCTSQGTWKPADQPVCVRWDKTIAFKILLLLLLLVVVLIIVLGIWFIQYRMSKNVISYLLSDTKMIAGVLLLKDAVQEAIDTLEGTWNPLKDCFDKFVWMKMKCKIPELAEQMKNLWKVSWENLRSLRSQVIDDLVKVESYKKSSAQDIFQAGKDFKRNVDQLLKSANVAATIPLYEQDCFSYIRQTKPENYVNEQTKAKRRIDEVVAWSVAQKERGDEIYDANKKLEEIKSDLNLLKQKIKTKKYKLASLNSQKERLEQEMPPVEEKDSKIKALEADIQLVIKNIQKVKTGKDNIYENIKTKTQEIDTRTEELDSLKHTFQSDASWQSFTLLQESLETVMVFWSDEQDSGEISEKTTMDVTSTV